MQLILDLPMVTPPRKQFGRTGLFAGHAGDRVFHLARRLTVFRDCSRQLAHLADVGPIEKVIQSGRTHKSPLFDAAARLFEGFMRLAFRLIFPLDVGGKRPPFPRRPMRCVAATWAGCF